jgi:hypothetical protein
MRAIRASEIGTYLYCQRAWGYMISGYEPQNQADLAAGTRLHETHGRTVVFAGGLRVLASLLFLAALALVIVYITGKVF